VLITNSTTNRAQRTPGQVLESHSALPDGLHDGVLITLVRSHDSRSSSFMLEFDGIAYGETVCLRPALMRRPVIASTLPARV